jgi:hypothetical protein
MDPSAFILYMFLRNLQASILDGTLLASSPFQAYLFFIRSSSFFRLPGKARADARKEMIATGRRTVANGHTITGESGHVSEI